MPHYLSDSKWIPSIREFRSADRRIRQHDDLEIDERNFFESYSRISLRQFYNLTFNSEKWTLVERGEDEEIKLLISSSLGKQNS